jgi:hypothetical protein
MSASGTGGQASIGAVGVDAPFSASALTYTIKGAAGTGTGSIPAFGTDSATEILSEIMG